MRRFTDLLKRFRRDESGAFLVLFAVIALVLIATSGAVVDFTYIQTARSRAQNALDAAALALQTRISTDSIATLKSKAQTMMTERIADSSIVATVNSATVDTTAGKLNFQAQVKVPTAFIQLVGIKSITAQLTSEVTKGSKDIEVSVALDTTGSMAGSKISDLIDATNTLIDLVVQDVQTPTYSKMAIVPWTEGANLGSYANSVRGTPTPGVTITNATWMATSTVSVNAMTNASPTVITTSANHNLNTNDYVYLSGVNGMTRNGNSKIPDGIYQVTKVDATHVNLLNSSGNNIDSSNWSAYSTSPSKASITKCYDSGCDVLVTTASAHGQSTGDTVYISGASGMSGLNGTHSGDVGAVPNTTSYYLTDEGPDTVGYNTYTASSATSYCTTYGCTWYYFTNAAGGHNTYKVNTCATDRTGTHAFDDAAPSTAPLGFYYESGGADCIVADHPAADDQQDALHALANSLTATNSTAGHLGLAWGWYMISPNFALSVADRQPAGRLRQEQFDQGRGADDRRRVQHAILQRCAGGRFHAGIVDRPDQLQLPERQLARSGRDDLHEHQGTGELDDPLHGRLRSRQRHLRAQLPQELRHRRGPLLPGRYRYRPDRGVHADRAKPQQSANIQVAT